MTIRTFQPGDERSQAALYNTSAFAFPGFKPATEDDVRRRTRARDFDPGCHFYATADGVPVGYCQYDPDHGRVSYPWCRKGHEAAAPELFGAVVAAARARGVAKLFAAYRRDWDAVLRFFADNGFSHARDMVNYAADPVELPTVASRTGPPLRRLARADLPALAAMGKGLIRIPADQMEAYYFSNPHFPVEAFQVMDGAAGPVAIGVGLELPTWADVKKVDPLAPCFRMGAFGTERLNCKRVNGLFGFVVAKPDQAISAGLALLAAASQEMTEGTVTAVAAQCPTDAPHLLNFYTHYFKEQGRFPVLERELG